MDQWLHLSTSQKFGLSIAVRGIFKKEHLLKCKKRLVATTEAQKEIKELPFKRQGRLY